MITLTEVSKTYANPRGKAGLVRALNGLSMTIETGQFVTVVGRSGSGKSTLLRILAGIDKPTTGRLDFSGSRPRIGFVFQANVLFPWRTVRDNLAFPLEIQGIPKDKRIAEAARISELIGLKPEHYLSRFPSQLSGGESRRVAIGMAIANRAELLLMDEPTSQLDFVTKATIQEVIQSIWSQFRLTVVQVTHDVDEAILLGDSVLVLEAGDPRGQVRIGLPRPRTSEQQSLPAFGQLRRDIMSMVVA